jgi:hypothetical protein
MTGQPQIGQFAVIEAAEGSSASSACSRRHLFDLERARGPAGNDGGQSSDPRGGRQQQLAALVHDLADHGLPSTSIRSTFSG